MSNNAAVHSKSDSPESNVGSRGGVYLVMHVKHPTYSMYFRDDVYSEPISTVNGMVVGVYKSGRNADSSARKYFFQKLGYKDSGESEEGGYYCSASSIDGDSGTWDEEVYVSYEPFSD